MKTRISKKSIDCLFSFSFMGIILATCILNFKTFYDQIKDGEFEREEVENLYKSEFRDKDKFSDLYGISLDLLNKRIVGNFEYVKDNSGIMHSNASANCSEADAEQFLEDMITLKEDLDRRGIPMVYVQIPSRELAGYSDYPSEVFNKTAGVIEKLMVGLDDAGIDTINVGEHCLNAEEAMSQDQFFFKTDIHLTTDAEMWVGKYVADYLNENTTCEIDKDIFDVTQYRKESYIFRGNLVKDSGRYFSQDDLFDVYYPNFETSMALDNRLQGIRKEGEFNDAILNEEFGKYWILSYLQWTSPYYKITNDYQAKNNVLMVMDSMCMRMVSYLSIGCHKVTILDTRYFDGIDLIDVALKSEIYDAVVICHQSSLFGHDFYPERAGKEVLSSMQSVNGANMCDVEFCNGVRAENTNILSVDTAQPYFELSGWAADLQSGLAAKNVYIAVGSHVIECEYGIESQSLSAFFENENLFECGVRVMIPTGLIMEENADSYQIWVVSADGKIVYKSLDYIINGDG